MKAFTIAFLVSLMISISALTVMAAPKPKGPTVGQKYCTGSTPCVLTSHNDGNRDGVNPNEATLKASTLNSGSHPVPQWLATTDGLIYAQPLYIHQLAVNGTPYNAVFAATENNSVYSLNSDATATTGAVLAQANLNDASDLSAGSTEIAAAAADLPGTCSPPGLQPEIGITGTPVIDVSVTPPVLYVVTLHEDVDSLGNKTFRQKLHGLFTDTLQEIPGSPLVLDTNFGTNHAPGWSPVYDNQRSGLALVKEKGVAKIWVTWASHCDDDPHFGFAIEFTYNYTGTNAFANAYTVFNTESSCTKQPCIGGIWMSGAAPAVDASGNVYVAVGNGSDTHQGKGEYSNSVVKLSDAGFQDFYSPPDYDILNRGHSVVACTNPNATKCPSPCKFDSTKQFCQLSLTTGDLDLGAGGVTLLAPSFALTNPEIVAAGKQGMIYVAFTKNLGQIDSHVADLSEYACTTSATPAAGSIAQCFLGLVNAASDITYGSRGAPAFLAGASGSGQNYLYFSSVSDTVKAFKLQDSTGLGTFATTPATPISGHIFSYPGASPSVTWNKAESSNITDAIVWSIDSGGYGSAGQPATPAVLYAYKAIPTGSGAGSLGAELWNTSAYNASVPGNPGAVKFVVPTIADGKIFVAGGAQGYEPGSGNCLSPTTTTQPTGCGGLAMYK
ncbi:MAG TPA: hypothetical protein VIH89_11440 [Candidatus Sulfotelmatobacter sp.]